MFGIKLYTDGVIIVDFEEIETETGKICPAKIADLKVGDIVKSINKINVTSSSIFSKLLQESRGKPVEMSILRNGKILNIKFETVPSYNENKKYKLAFKWYMQAFDMGEIQLYPEILRLEVDKKDYKTWTAWVEYLVSMFTELANDGDIDASLQLVEIYEYIEFMY